MLPSAHAKLLVPMIHTKPSVSQSVTQIINFNVHPPDGSGRPAANSLAGLLVTDLERDVITVRG